MLGALLHLRHNAVGYVVEEVKRTYLPWVGLFEFGGVAGTVGTQVVFERKGEVGDGLRVEQPVVGAVGGEQRVEVRGQIAAVVDERPPSPPPLVEAVVSRIGAKQQQQAKQNAHRRQKLGGRVVQAQVNEAQFNYGDEGDVGKHPSQALEE